MQEDIQVSVIMPVYNLEKWIKASIDSLLKQTFSKFEVILIDDGSTDQSLEIMKAYQRKYPDQLRVIEQTNHGQGYARNRGIEQAKGKYIVMVDGDDYVADDYLAKLYACMEQSSLDCIVCGYTKVTESGEVLEVIHPKAERDIFRMQFTACCSKMFRKSFWQEHQIRFPEGKLYEDIPVSWMMMHLTDKVEAISYAGYYYLQRENSSSHRKLEFTRIPFQAYEEAIARVMHANPIYCPQIFRYSIISFATFFIFQIGRKADKECIEMVCERLECMVRLYCPEYSKIGWKLLGEGLLPLKQRLGCFVFTLSVQMHLLKLVGYCLTR